MLQDVPCSTAAKASSPPAPAPASLQVLESEYDAQKNIAPFLENRVLRRIVQVGDLRGGKPQGSRAMVARPCWPWRDRSGRQQG